MQDLSKMSTEELLALRQRSQQGQIVQDPTYQAQTAVGNMQPERERAEIERIRAELARTQQQLQQDQIETEETVEEREQLADAQRVQEMRGLFKTDTVLSAIRRARNIAQTEGGVGWSGLLKDLPETSAKKLDSALKPILGNLAFDRLQEMRNASKTGGALGQVSERELSLLQSTVADLDQTVDLESFLTNLDTIERSFIGAQMAASGIDPNTDLGRGIMVDEYGYAGNFDGMPAEDFSLASGDTAADVLPEAYQKEHLRYLRENWRNIKPEQYVQFRVGLDERFGLTPDLRAYEDAAYNFNSFAAEGGSPQQLGAVPSPEREVGMIEGALNKGAQTGLGTYASQAGNAVTAGLLGQVTGNQDVVELQRQARPGASFVGELTGGALGATALGAAGAAASGGGRLASMIAGPYGADAAHSTIYGGTQDGLRGAAYGLGGALAGGTLGRMIGRNIAPEVFAPNAAKRADELVPTTDALRAQESAAYDVARAGNTIPAQETERLGQRLEFVLSQTDELDSTGKFIGADPAIRQAYDRVQDLRGQALRPGQLEEARKLLRDAGGNTPRSQRIAGLLTEEFDRWADPILPDFTKARGIAQRRIQGEGLQRELDAAYREGAKQKGNDVGDAIRTRFGQMDRSDALGKPRFTPQVQDAIGQVSQGDRTTNLLRSAGVMGNRGMGGVGILTGGGLSAASGNPLPAMLSGASYLGGRAVRGLASRNTQRQAQEAVNTALSQADYIDALEAYKQQAANRGGNFFGGLFGAASSAYNR